MPKALSSMTRDGFSSRTASIPSTRDVSAATTRSPLADSSRDRRPSMAIGSVSHTATLSTSPPASAQFAPLILISAWTSQYFSRGGRNRSQESAWELPQVVFRDLPLVVTIKHVNHANLLEGHRRELSD